MKQFHLLFALLMVFFIACKHEGFQVEEQSELKRIIAEHSPTQDIGYYIMPNSDDYANIPNQDPKNPVTAAKAALGKLLFFEPAIGVKGMNPQLIATYSCSSCHIPERSFTPGRFQGIADGAVGFGHFGDGRNISPLYQGHEVDAQGARPLPTINLAYVKNALWSGAFGSTGLNTGTEAIWGVADTMTSINNKIFEGLEANNHRALIVHRQAINKPLMDYLGYTEMFDKAFPDVPPSERYTLQMASNAIAAYFRTIYTNEAPFQKWLKGDENAMTQSQKNGAQLFYTKAGCINCHNSPSFNGQRFAALGVKDLDQSGYVVFKTTDGRSKGRASFTLNDNDLYKFKVPQLYNLKNIGFYFHGASKQSLEDVVRYFNDAIPENEKVESHRIDPLFKPLSLTEQEIKDLTDFIENGLNDPNLLRYKPEHVLSSYCFPNNDPQSKADMSCY